MSVTTTIQAPPEFIEAAAKPFITQLQQVTGDLSQADLSQVYGPQFVAGLDPLQQQAEALATSGVGSYKPFLEAAAAWRKRRCTKSRIFIFCRSK